MLLSDSCFITDHCPRYKKGLCTEQFCPKLFKLEQLYNSSLLSEKQRERVPLRLDSDNRDLEAFRTLQTIQDSIETFVNAGQSLLIHSPICGNGKTAWAIRLLQSYFEHIWYKADASVCHGLFINVPRLFISLKESITQSTPYIEHITKNIETADLVVWDEIGTKALTDYEHEHLLKYINTRIDLNKANIYTSNLDACEIMGKLGERLYSRVYNLSTIIQLKGLDKRGIV